MATSQPIALPVSHQDSNDYSMGSYSGSNPGSFNPASYTRHFLGGSPISWRAGSFSARFPHGSPSAHLFSSLDHPKSSPSTDEVSLMNAFNVFDREGELCRNYNCCGLHLQDLHALLEHFEEVHVLVVDPATPAQITVPFNPQPIDSSSHHHHHQHTNTHPLNHQSSFDTDDMELELDLDNSTLPPPHPGSTHSSPSSSAPSPPHTPNNPSLLQFAHQFSHFQHQTPYTSAQTSPYTSQPPSPGSSSSNPANNSATMLPHLQSVGVHYANHTSSNSNVLTHPEEAFNAYARFAADYSSHMPGTQFNASGGEEIVVNQMGAGDYVGQLPNGVSPVGGQQGHGQQCIPPALLFASASSNNDGETSHRDARASVSNANKLRLKMRTGQPTTSHSTPNTPSTTTPSTLTSFNATTNMSASGTSTPVTPSGHTPTPPTLPTPSLLLSKPFRCPKPNCNKSYKQANGLKYHMTHGSCNFAPPKDLEHVKDLLERKRREREANAAAAAATSGLSRSASLGALSGRSPGSTPEPLLHSAYGDLGSITETELREVEREAEKRLKPFACGVGDCQRRYKNMNGLRYHYQHSGEHGALGLALLAGGVHECLSSNSNSNNSSNNNNGSIADGGKGRGKPDEREGRRRGGPPGVSVGVHRSLGSNSIRGGSVSVPVSRATSISRVGTPNPKTGYATNGSTTPYSPTYTNSPSTLNTSSNSNDGAATTPPLTPLTAAVQGLGLGNGVGASSGVLSQPHSPTQHGQTPYPIQQQQQQQQQPSPSQSSSPRQGSQQMAYQPQFADIQLRQYLQSQQVAQAMQAQQQQQQQQQHHQAAAVYQQQQQQYQLAQQQQLLRQAFQQQQLTNADTQAQVQQEFADAQREFELQQQQQQQQQQRVDPAMT